MTVNELIKQLNEVDNAHKDKEVKVMENDYICVKEENNKVRIIIVLN